MNAPIPDSVGRRGLFRAPTVMLLAATILAPALQTGCAGSRLRADRDEALAARNSAREAQVRAERALEQCRLEKESLRVKLAGLQARVANLQGGVPEEDRSTEEGTPKPEEDPLPPAFRAGTPESENRDLKSQVAALESRIRKGERELAVLERQLRSTLPKGVYSPRFDPYMKRVKRALAGR